MLRPIRITCEIIASLVGIAVLLGLFLAWRLSQGSLQSSVLTPYLESGIESLVPDTQASIDHTLLAWDNTDHSITLHADNVQVTDKNGKTIAAVPELDMQLSVIGMMFGQFLPTALIVNHPQIHLQRRSDGSFVFGSTIEGTTFDASNNDEGNLKDSITGIANHLLHAFFTHHLQISRAVFDVHDIATNNDWSVSIPETSLDRSGRELTGQAAIDVMQKDKTSTIEVHYAYDRINDLHRLVTRFSAITPAFFAGGNPATLGLGQASIANLPLTGEIALALDDALNVASGTVQLHGDAGTLNNPALWDAPRAVKSLDIKADYDQQKNTLNIPSATIDFGGPRISLQATGKPQAKILTALTGAQSRTMDIYLSIQLDNWPMDQYGQLWPKPIIPDVREWIAANLTKGTFDHAEGGFKGSIDLAHPDNINFTEGDGKVAASGARVQYVDGMPPVENVSTNAAFDLNGLTAQITSGGIGDIKIVPFTIAITGFEDDVQNIQIPLKVTGPIPSILTLIDQPPLEYAKAVGLKPDEVTGQVDAEVTFHFPLLKTLTMNDIGVVASANLSQVASSKLVPGIDIAQGSLALNLIDTGFEIKGPASINAIPLQVTWQQKFNESTDKPLKQATLTGSLGVEQWQALGVDAFDGTKGGMSVSLQMTQPGKANKMFFSGTIDMTGADVYIDQLNWKKPAQVSAIANFAAEKNGDTIEITSIDLHGPQMDVKGKATLSGDNAQLTALTLNPMIVGRTNASLYFSRINDDTDALHFDASGEALDISGFKSGKVPENSKPQPKEFRIKVGKLYTSEKGFIAKAEGYAIRDPQGWSEINLHGLADGEHQLNVDLSIRADGGRNFAITCDDFGKALKGLGFTDTVKSGNLDIHGESDPADPRAIVGKVTIGSFNVGDFPMLAVLMNAASPFGFAGLFTGSMDFDHVNGKFRWEGDMIRLANIHAAGASVGLNIDGKLDMASNTADLRGTMVPFSMVNGIIGSIPIIGDLFTGGKDQGIFAVSYTITGAVDRPNISVNPVSLLTPGFLRNLFFGGSDDDDETPENRP